MVAPDSLTILLKIVLASLDRRSKSEHGERAVGAFSRESNVGWKRI
jgi:hypothetical protein